MALIVPVEAFYMSPKVSSPFRLLLTFQYLFLNFFRAFARSIWNNTVIIFQTFHHADVGQKYGKVP